MELPPRASALTDHHLTHHGNAITLIRSLLAFVVVAMLHTQTRNVYLTAAALEQGMTAFGSSSMNRSKLGVLLVSSRLSRAPTGSRRLLPVRS